MSVLNQVADQVACFSQIFHQLRVSNLAQMFVYVLNLKQENL